MKKDNCIFLVGLAASGKTTLGSALAEHMQISFIDLDHAIEKRVGMSIPEFFAEQGEGSFRLIEKEVLLEIMAIQEGFVMATGGGAPCYHFNIDAMNNHGITVYLEVPPGDLALRIMEEGLEKRPVFKSYDQLDLISEIRAMKELRTPFYEQADIHIKGHDISVEKLYNSLQAFSANH
mgnify:CR=1 FL=1